MGMEEMMADEPPATFKKPNVPNATDEFGIADDDLVVAQDGVVGRLRPLSARQVEAWAAQAIQADYEFVTTEECEAENGWFLEVDDRLFRITGLHKKRMTKGTIPSYFSYTLVEAKRK